MQLEMDELLGSSHLRFWELPRVSKTKIHKGLNYQNSGNQPFEMRRSGVRMSNASLVLA
jgi:hypothetical protein